MDSTHTPLISPAAEPADAAPITPLSRRGFLTAAAVASGSLVAVGLAACTPAGAPSWSFAPASPHAVAASAAATAGAPTMSHGSSQAPSAAPSASAPIDHDANAAAVVKRFLGGEGATLPAGNQPLKPTLDGTTKVFELSIDPIQHRIDAVKEPIAALGFNGTWPGPRLTVAEGDMVRAIFTNNLDESTGSISTANGCPTRWTESRTSPRSRSGRGRPSPTSSGARRSARTCTTHITTRPTRSGVACSERSSSSRRTAQRYDRLYGATQDIVWISNDALGGFTINGRGFPATEPIVATLGETIVIRFMNEGIMTHPWHLHGMPMRVVARDGYPLGSAAFTCDTLGVNPGERWDVVIDCDAPGAWAFHCHILRTPRGWTGCMGWSRPWSCARMPRPTPSRRPTAGAIGVVGDGSSVG